MEGEGNVVIVEVRRRKESEDEGTQEEILEETQEEEHEVERHENMGSLQHVETPNKVRF